MIGGHRRHLETQSVRDRRRRRRKFLATTFLRALGFPTDRDIAQHFYNIEKLKLSENIDEEELGHKVPFEDILDGELTVAKAYEPLTIGIVRQLIALGHKSVEVIDSNEDEILLKSLRKDPAEDEESEVPGARNGDQQALPRSDFPQLRKRQ